MARRFAARIGVVREAAGIVAYRAGHFSEALSDLRAARRMTGSEAYLPVMADCERGLGRPERAIDLVRSPEAERLDRAGRIELTIVESGARRDLGQHDAAVITLQRLPELRDPQSKPWSARLAFAYADALADAGHQEAATDWFGRAMAFDDDGETDAAERYAELTGAVIEDLEEDYEEEPLDGDLPESQLQNSSKTEAGSDEADLEDAEADEDEADEIEALAEAADLLADEPVQTVKGEREQTNVPDNTQDTAAKPASESADAQRTAVEPDSDGVHGAAEGGSGVGSGDVRGAAEGGSEAGSGDVRDAGAEAGADSGDVLDAVADQPAAASEAAAQSDTPSITPAFIEPDFGDNTLEDEPNERAEGGKPKTDN
ncbi:hypothetical protein ABZ897_17280 [Nonomuraea sp. NPDC046802]|uniref:hypothetical protein n=1 Tax=Nonomuraea sp. NPDC046802 TaxID=3154919 RepID=UPI0033C7AC38